MYENYKGGTYFEKNIITKVIIFLIIILISLLIMPFKVLGFSFSGNSIIRNCISIGNVAEDVYKVIGGINGKTAGELIDKKDYINNVFENSGATGISNANADNNIKQVNDSTYMTKSFYTEILGWSEEIWDLNNIQKEPSIKFWNYYNKREWHSAIPFNYDLIKDIS